MTKSIAAALALAFTLACCASAGEYTYPKCSATGTGCCAFGTGSMRNRGYIVLHVDDGDMIVTCKSGALLCTTGNPGNTAVATARENVTCPDFGSLMESRSTLTYLEGVSTSTESADEEDEASPGTVTAAEDA